MGTVRSVLVLVALTCAMASVFGESAGSAQGPAASLGRLAWGGTVTVTRHASGAVKSDDGKARLGFDGDETITFRLGPDGVATFDATYRSRIDMSGEYALPTAGSGSGTTYYGIGFNGVNWEVLIDGGDNIPVQTDHTAEDQWWAHQFRGLLELSAALDGKSVPAIPARMEKGGRGINGAAFVATGNARSKSLSGSHTEKFLGSGPEGLDGPGTIPTVITTTWNLTLGPVEPKVAIRGPECGCLDADETAPTELRFRAGTTVPGGEFSEFEVIPEGKAPEIVSNEGGERPELVLTGTKDTGAVTLKIHYRKDGKRYEAPPMRVEFCTLEDIELEDGVRDLVFEGEELKVKGKAHAWHNGEEVSKDLKWELEKMGSPSTLSSEPSDARGEKIAFTYKGLPEKSDSFGPRRLMVSMTRGKCACQKTETPRLFFDGDDNSHPGDESPNWFYYWSQTGAVTAAARQSLRYQETIVDRNLPSARPIAKYDHDSQLLLLSSSVHEENACRKPPGGSGAGHEGIDCFASTVRHEWQHRQDAIDWWGSAAGASALSLPEWFAKDWDHDQVPNTVEDREAGCKYGSFVSITPSGGQETWFTCDKRPFTDATDAEINAYRVGWTWPTGSVNKEDWSCGKLGKQWRGKGCGQ